VSVRLVAFLMVLASSRADDDELMAGALDVDHQRWIEFAARQNAAPTRDRAIIIGVRGRDLDGNVHDTRVVREYDDTLVIVKHDKLLKLRVSTHPWETAGHGVPDANGDGKPDIGMIRPGRYLAVKRPSSRNIAGAPTFHVRASEDSERIPAWRNTNQDDVYGDDERAEGEARGDYQTAILFHQGGAGAPAAIGCQVLDAAGIRTLASEVGARFDYLLVDAHRVDGLP
jgi:hypothetical protein